MVHDLEFFSCHIWASISAFPMTDHWTRLTCSCLVFSTCSAVFKLLPNIMMSDSLKLFAKEIQRPPSQAFLITTLCSLPAQFSLHGNDLCLVYDSSLPAGYLPAHLWTPYQDRFLIQASPVTHCFEMTSMRLVNSHFLLHLTTHRCQEVLILLSLLQNVLQFLQSCTLTILLFQYKYY